MLPLPVVMLLPAVPAVSAGPDLAEQAALLSAPISEVTVYSDRARVRRRARADLPRGVRAVRWPDLPGAVLLDTIRMNVEKATLLRVQASTIDRERVAIDQADALLDRFDALSDQLSLLDAERKVLDLEIALVGRLSPAPLVPEGQREGRPLPALQPDIYRRALDFLSEVRATARNRQRAIDGERRTKSEELAQVERELQALDLGGFSDRKIEVIALIETDGTGKDDLELEYFVPGASWRPAYVLDFDPDRGQVTMGLSGLVEQASGEAWDDAGIELSTAIPGQSIELPEMLTWTLGEAKEFIPTPRPRTTPPVIPLNPPPQPTLTDRERARAARAQALTRRLSQLGHVAEAKTPSYQVETETDFDDRTIAGELARPDAQFKPERKRLMPSAGPPPPPPAPSAAPMPMSRAQHATVLAEPAEESVVSGRSDGSQSGAPSFRSVPLSLFDAPAKAKVRFADPSLPAMLAGGLDYVYRSPAKVAVPSTGVKVKVPLFSDRHSVTTYYEASPALASNAFLTASVKNEGQRPILGGPVGIFVKGAFVGEGSLATTGPGGVLQLPLGADEDIRLTRKVIPETNTHGLFSKSDTTHYRVVIEAGNYKAKSVKVSVLEVLPKSGHEDIEIELLRIDPRPNAGPNAQGILRWDVEIAAGKTKILSLEYRVERPANWQLYQR